MNKLSSILCIRVRERSLLL